MALVIQGEDLERARRLLEDGSRTGERLGNRWSVGIAAVYLGLLELRLGRLKEAAAHWRHALTPLAELGDHALLTVPFCGLGRALVHTDARRALTLVAFAVEMRARIGGRFPPAWVELVDQTRGQGERLLGKTAADSAWQRGLRLSVADAIRLAQGQEVAGAAAGPLSRREREVAELIADGLSNRVVSHRLHISERTVEGHVLHILNKLGLENRTQVAAWLRRSGTGTSTG
jgi:non-specific serine/threonine protein kinase